MKSDLNVADSVYFTEDNWNTTYEGGIVEITIYSYLINSFKYGTFYIPKSNVKLKERSVPLWE